MPKQTTTTDNDQTFNPLNALATKLKMEQAEQQLRIANYFVPFGFDPEQVDFDRAGQLIETHGDNITARVFGQASANLQERVIYAMNEIALRQASLEALYAAGASVTATDEQLYAHAVERVFSTSRAGQQAAHARVA